MKLFGKIIFSLLASAAIMFCGFIAMIYVAFSVYAPFYSTFVIVIAAVICVFVVMQIWNLPKPRIRYIFMGVTAVALILTVAGVEINRAYKNSFEEVNEGGVDLSLYEPFREDTLAVSLNEKSTLKLTDNLPKLDGATALYPLYSAFAKAAYYNIPQKPDTISKKQMTLL